MDGTNVSIGYSIPSIRPSTVVACGQGYLPQVSLKCLMVNHAILLASSHGVASGRYSVWIRMPCQAEASQRKSGEGAQAKARTLGAPKGQVLVPGVRRAACAVASAFVMTATRPAEARARARRARSVALHTARGFCTVPVAATTNPAGSVSVTSKSPYSR